MTAAEDRLLEKARNTVRLMAEQRGQYHSVVPVPWTTRFIDWLLRILGV